MKIDGYFLILSLVIGVVGLAPSLNADSYAATNGAQVHLTDSIKEIPINGSVAEPHRTRANLMPAEMAEILDFVVSLRMKNFDELESRIHAGQAVGRAEMDAKYLPNRADYDLISSWLQNQGFTLTVKDPNHVNVFARGTISQLSSAFGMTFARVSTVEGEFTSAVTAPSLPQDIAAPILGIDGLQPHIRMHVPKARSAGTDIDGYFTPSDIAVIYSLPSDLMATGQTIAIIMDAAPASDDLIAFVQAYDFNAPRVSSTYYPILGGPTNSSQSQDADEAALDAEWSAALAPGAKLNIYGIPALNTSNLLAACTQILADAATDPSLTVVSYSASGPESLQSASALMADSQGLAELAAANITFLASSGDGGSNPYPPNIGKAYGPANPLEVEYPASDPNVTGVGGTTLSLSSIDTNGPGAGETAWNTGIFATGGGLSDVFSRPSWQTGSGLPSGDRRCVPDIAAVANANTPASPDTGAVILVNGQDSGIEGTSLSAPVWAGFIAMINQARSQAGLGSLGLLGPKMYPLMGTSAFNDITSGNNGAYNAGPGYDLCTGIGSPNVGLLASEFSGGAFVPITVQPQGQLVSLGQNASFTITATGYPAPSYQWKVSTDGGATWSNLTDGGGVSGSTTATLNLDATLELNGNLYECAVNNGVGSATSTAAPLTITNAYDVFTTLAGSAQARGNADGLGLAARFYDPTGVAVDKAGNLYVADSYNGAIRLITPAAVVSTIAGAAHFSWPTGVALDDAGNVYVADAGNETVCEITPTPGSGSPAWAVITLAGMPGQSGSADGAGTAARFDGPMGVAVDGAGNIYVADTDNETIRKITPALGSGGMTWTVSTLAGTAKKYGLTDGLGAAAAFTNPAGVTTDGAGNVYVADQSNNAIRKITPAGAVTTLAGGIGNYPLENGAGTVAGFSSPSGVAVDGMGNIYVADTDDNAVRLITPAGAVTTLANSFGIPGSEDGAASTAQFYRPFGVAVDSAGAVYVADTYNCTIRKGALPNEPLIVMQPAEEMVAPGADASFTAAFSGFPTPIYHWQVSTDGGTTWTGLADGDGISGSATTNLTLMGLPAGFDGNLYRCVATNSSGTLASAPATLLVNGPPFIVDQPISQTVASGSTVVFAVVAGDSPQSAQAPPAGQLTPASLGITYQWQFNGSSLHDGNGISGSLGPQLLIVGASSTSQGDYTCVVTTAGGAVTSNVGQLVATISSNPGLATSISTRAFVGTGDDILIGGFYIVGSTSRTVLIQALGPALAVLGVTDALQHPTLSIHQTQNGGDVTLYSNTGWGSSQILLDAAASVYATPVLAQGSADSELLVTLPPGGYSAEVSGADGGTGVALCAIYELP